MERFLKRKIADGSSSTSGSNNIPHSSTLSLPNRVELKDLPLDPVDRPRILDYDTNQRQKVRQLYWQRGPFQPRGHIFPTKIIGNTVRRFVPTWFDEFPWLEYSIKADKVFCLCCYLFKDNVGKQGGGDAFVTQGFDSWNKKDRLNIHVGDVSSLHNKAKEKCENLMKKNQCIVAFHKQSETGMQEYWNASIDVCRFLAKNALPFYESENSSGLYIETLTLLGSANENIRNAILWNAMGNNQMVSSSVRKDILCCFASEILKSIFQEIGNDVFALLVDELSDAPKKEQMAVVLRYVNARGLVKERFVGFVHVMEATSSNLKSTIDSLFTEHGLSLKQIRGQSYNGASNMLGEFNGLKDLILKEHNSAYYVHCFGNQFQLAAVAVAKSHNGVGNFFDMLATMMNVICSPCKQKDMIREGYRDRVQEAISKGEIEIGGGLNQEISLIRGGDTHWGSHHRTMLCLICLFPEVIMVLKYVEEDGDNSLSRRQAHDILEYLSSYDFGFYLHLMLHILGLTNVLSRALQRKDQNIVEAVSLIRITKQALQNFRENGFGQILEKTNSFCKEHDLEILNMEECYITSRNRRGNITNQHHFEVDVFNAVLDVQIQEFGDRFNEVSIELLTNMAALSPCASFAMFDASKLVELSKFYPYDFNDIERNSLERELDIYYETMHRDERFTNLDGISDLARLMVETGKHVSYPYVYRLLKLALVLPIATATVERCFSAMKLIKSDLRNRMSDDFLNDSLICAIEKEALLNVTNEVVINRLQIMKDPREQLEEIHNCSP